MPPNSVDCTISISVSIHVPTIVHNFVFQSASSLRNLNTIMAQFASVYNAPSPILISLITHNMLSWQQIPSYDVFSQDQSCIVYQCYKLHGKLATSSAWTSFLCPLSWILVITMKQSKYEHTHTHIYIYIWGEYLGPRGMRMGSGGGSTMSNFIVCTVHLI